MFIHIYCVHFGFSGESLLKFKGTCAPISLDVVPERSVAMSDSDASTQSFPRKPMRLRNPKAKAAPPAQDDDIRLDHLLRSASGAAAALHPWEVRENALIIDNMKAEDYDEEGVEDFPDNLPDLVNPPPFP
jgi:hypothetical protein